MIFEVKTVDGNELSQTRGALAQLLEYRVLYGEPSDEACLVANSPLTDRRVRLLRSLLVDAVWLDGDELLTCGQPISKSLRALLQ